jgi:enoyl-CoA hydratase/carnithine racemase
VPESLVLCERDGAVATLVLNDPGRRNALSEAMGEALREQVTRLARDAALRAVIVTGAGPGFCAGGELEMLEARAREAAASGDPSRTGVRDAMRGFYARFLSLRDLPCPVLAAVHGACIGAGLCLALACDLRLVAAGARLALNFARLGLHPGMGATWLLPRLVGPAAAAELLYTGRALDAEEAVRLGLASRVLAPEALLPAARELASEIALSAPLAVRGIKRSLRRSPAAELEDQLAFEAELQAHSLATRDAREGLAALRERRAPRFEGS